MVERPLWISEAKVQILILSPTLQLGESEICDHEELPKATTYQNPTMKLL